MFGSYPPAATEEQVEYLAAHVKNWTAQHGLLVRPSTQQVSEDVNPNKVLATNAPVTLFPSPFPRKNFEQARSLQTIYNELYAAIASNEKWLESIMKELIEVDEFLAQLWKIHLAVKEEGYAHQHALGMFRSDYMLDTSSTPTSLKQVEFNTISSSFGGLSSLVSQLHTELLSFPTPQQPLAYPQHPLFTQMSSSPSPTSSGIPAPNTAVATLTTALATAHTTYGASKSSPALPLCILFLVQDNERNIFDQLALSSHLFNHHHIPSFRLPTSSILSQTTIPDKSTNPARPLIYHPPSSPSTPYEVTTVYFRALYAPSEYTSPTHWAGRHHLERSCAIKCPSILLHLSGSKKIQQVLTCLPPNTDHLSNFLSHHPAPTISNLRATFAKQYSMTSPEGLKLALNPETAEHHVLKPQREGGGNNIYRSIIPTFLKSIPEKDYKQYILMELIHPPKEAKNTVLRSDGEVVSGEVISELGIFGGCLWKVPTAGDVKEGEGLVRPEILLNSEGGYLLRTKASGNDEGGVAAGFSSLDSVVLYDDEQDDGQI
jgi:glutathione synthase